MTTSGARERILGAASALFADEGIRAVGVDRVCAVAGVSKRSLYQHYGSKDAVIGAVLQARAEAFARGLEAAGRTPRQRITDVFAAQAAAAGSSPFTGCPFVAAATELKEPDHPGAVLARTQKELLTAYLADAARAAGATDPDQLAAQLLLVFDGADAWSVVRGEPAAAVGPTVELLLAHHGVGDAV